MSDLAFDQETFDVSIGTVDDPNGGFAVGGLGEEGVRFATTGNSLTGDVGRQGATATVGGPAGDALLEAEGDFSARTAEISSETGTLFAHFGEEGAVDGTLEAQAGGVSIDASGVKDGGKGVLAVESGNVTRTVSADAGGIVNGVSQTTGDDEVTFEEELGARQALTVAHDDTASIGLVRGEGAGVNGSIAAGPLTASGSVVDGVVDGKATLAGGGVTTGVVLHEGGAGDRSLAVNAGGEGFSAEVGMAETAAGLTSSGKLTAQPTDALSFEAGLSTTTGGGKTTEAAELAAKLDTENFDASLGIKGGAAGTEIDASAEGKLGEHVTVEGALTTGGAAEEGKLAVGIDSDVIAGNLALAGKSPDGLTLDAEALAQVHKGIFAGGVAQVGEAGTFVGGELVMLPTKSTAISVIAGGGTQGPGARVQLDVAGNPIEGPRGVLDSQGIGAHAFAEVGHTSALQNAIGNPDSPGQEIANGVTVGIGINGKF